MGRQGVVRRLVARPRAIAVGDGATPFLRPDLNNSRAAVERCNIAASCQQDSRKYDGNSIYGHGSSPFWLVAPARLADDGHASTESRRCEPREETRR
jgi:hypothetical protein